MSTTEKRNSRTRLGDIRSRLYKRLASLRTSVYLIGLLCLFYVLGTVFPQGGNMDAYSDAGGGFSGGVRLLGLLNIFDGPVFLVAAFVLLLNLAVCSYERLMVLTRQGRSVPQSFEPQFTIDMPMAKGEAEAETTKALKEKLGFRPLSSEEWCVMEKGLSYRWLTWLYHTGIIACFLGFMLSGLFVVEGMVTLRPGEPTRIVSEMPGMPEELGWLRSADHPEPDFQLVLDEFITEYTRSPHLDYPRDKVSRLAVALGWKDVSYEIKDDSLFPKDWKSRLRVVKGDLTVHEKTIEVNDPLKFEGYTFYQMSFNQTMKLMVDRNPIFLEAEAGEKLLVPGLDGELKFGTMRTGTLFKLDGTKEEITPFVMVKRITSEGDKRKTEEFGRLDLHHSLTVDDKTITFISVEESSILSYRYDPGVWLLYIAGIFVLVAMSLRCFGGWYLVAFRVEEAGVSGGGGTTRLLLSMDTRGLRADPEKIKKRLEYHLSRR
ncbi:MAG: cytochrome c biogenesis protein ResB [Thermodesulfobacteriota bacterium]